MVGQLYLLLYFYLPCWTFYLRGDKTRTPDLPIDLFSDTAAILNSIVSNSYYGMLRGQISMYLPPEHPIIDICNNGIQNGRRIGKKVYYLDHLTCHVIIFLKFGRSANWWWILYWSINVRFRRTLCLKGFSLISCIEDRNDEKSNLVDKYDLWPYNFFLKTRDGHSKRESMEMIDLFTNIQNQLLK